MRYGRSNRSRWYVGRQLVLYLANDLWIVVGDVADKIAILHIVLILHMYRWFGFSSFSVVPRISPYGAGGYRDGKFSVMMSMSSGTPLYCTSSSVVPDW